jgi:signal recognition particle subunit SRP54
MFNNLSEKLESAFKHLKGQSRINELNVANTLKDIRKALLDADVNFKIAKEFTDAIKVKAMGEKVINAISPGQLMVKIVQDELTALMGSEAALLDTSKNPTIILVAGLQGSGKTTFSGKLATYLKAQKKISFIGGSRYLSSSCDGSINSVSRTNWGRYFC